MLATERFAALMSEPEEDVPLDEACLLISARARGIDAVHDGLAALDRLSGSLSETTPDGLRSYLFGNLGFRGDRRTYTDPRNSYLDQVIARRRGIPITLAVVTIEVARRVGLALSPIGMPGHFLVGLPSGAFLDAFERGQVLDEDACRRRFSEVAGQDARWSPDLLEPVGTHAVLARVLANLRHSFLASNDLVNLDWVFELRALIPGVPAQERAERASVLAALGRVDEAAGQLEALADLEEAGGTGHPSGGPVGTSELRHRAARLRAELN